MSSCRLLLVLFCSLVCQIDTSSSAARNRLSTGAQERRLVDVFNRLQYIRNRDHSTFDRVKLSMNGVSSPSRQPHHHHHTSVPTDTSDHEGIDESLDHHGPLPADWSRMDLSEYRLFHSDASLECCPTETSLIHRVSAINFGGIVVELLNNTNVTQRFYETFCLARFKDRRCQYIDPKLTQRSRCLQQFSYVYAIARPYGSEEPYDVELVRVATGCKCKLLDVLVAFRSAWMPYPSPSPSAHSYSPNSPSTTNQIPFKRALRAAETVDVEAMSERGERPSGNEDSEKRTTSRSSKQGSNFRKPAVERTTSGEVDERYLKTTGRVRTLELDDSQPEVDAFTKEDDVPVDKDDDSKYRQQSNDLGKTSASSDVEPEKLDTGNRIYSPDNGFADDSNIDSEDETDYRHQMVNLLPIQGITTDEKKVLD